MTKCIRVLWILGIGLFLAMGSAYAQTSRGSTGSGPEGHRAFRGGPPPWAPARGERAAYHYLYYPDATVYFDSDRELYFYPRNDKWVKAPNLPRTFRSRLGDSVTLDMMTPYPYEFHQEVIRFYPAQARRHETARYEYRYYPASAIYYDVQRHVYFYPYKGSWRKTRTLPKTIYIDRDRFVTLDMDTDEPYIHHSETVRKYPREWRREHREEYRGKRHEERYHDNHEKYYDEHDRIDYKEDVKVKKNNGKGQYKEKIYYNENWKNPVKMKEQE